MTENPFPPLLLIGAGRMGAALFAGWTRAGLAPSILIDPAGAPFARPQDRVLPDLANLPADVAPAAIILAVKPQIAPTIFPALREAMPPATPVVSIMAGIRAPTIAAALGGAPVVRAMPNTPAAIGLGMTVCYAGPDVSAETRDLAERLLGAAGDVGWIDDESLIDPVTAISGSGPAYVFLLAELLEKAGLEQGVPAPLARQMARQTVAGAGALLAATPEDASELRRNVTSPKGTTERAIAVLMETWPDAVSKAVAAGTERARELASGGQAASPPSQRVL